MIEIEKKKMKEKITNLVPVWKKKIRLNTVFINSYKRISSVIQ